MRLSISKMLVTLFAICMCAIDTSAQTSWQWAKRGGSSDNTGSVGNGYDEEVGGITTDWNGNVYAAGVVAQTGLNIDGHPLTSYMAFGYNWYITTFGCDGSYRWSKMISGSNGGGRPVSIHTDTLGGVYVLGGFLNYDPFHLELDALGTDTTIPGSTHIQQIMLIKYDTLGNFKWFRFPESDTITQGVNRSDNVYDLAVDKNGDCYILCLLTNGAHCSGMYLVNSPQLTSVHILKFNGTGSFMGGMPLDMTVTGEAPPTLKMKHDVRSGRYYITGQLQGLAGTGTLTFGTSLISNGLFAAAFNSSGSLIWQKQGHVGYPAYGGGSFTDLDLDADGNIFLTGSIRLNDTFNTFTAINPFTTVPYSGPFIVKTDTNGNNMWAASTYHVSGELTSIGLTICGNEVTIAGSEGGRLVWPGYPDTLYTALGTYLYNVYVTRFNATTGAVLALDTVASPLTRNEYSQVITSDRFHNVYVGGAFQEQMFFSCGDTLTSIGGEYDFFIAKYGTSNCSEIPAGLITSNNKHENVHVYPNPTTDELTIEHVQPGSTIRIYNLMGQVVRSFALTSTLLTISIRNLVPGNYVVQATDNEGNLSNSKLLKE